MQQPFVSSNAVRTKWNRHSETEPPQPSLSTFRHRKNYKGCPCVFLMPFAPQSRWWKESQQRKVFATGLRREWSIAVLRRFIFRWSTAQQSCASWLMHRKLSNPPKLILVTTKSGGCRNKAVKKESRQWLWVRARRRHDRSMIPWRLTFVYIRIQASQRAGWSPTLRDASDESSPLKCI